MPIRFLVSIASAEGWAAAPGEVLAIDNAEAARLVAAGYAEPVAPPATPVEPVAPPATKAAAKATTAAKAAAESRKN